jgi:phosphoribosyl 1,2-cyclic phosphate phosphodiesterase
MKLVVLGSGTSHGIPVVGCSCPVCRSPDHRDRRMRASLYIEGDGGERAVIDAGPEFRLQTVRAGVTRLDLLLLTHAHADHIHGLDDVRPLTREHPLPVYGNEATLEELRTRFSYIFRETQRGGGKPRILLRTAHEPVHAGSLSFIPLPVKHGILDILGWKITEGKKTAVYLTDTNAIPVPSRAMIGKPEILIIDGLRERSHETHFSFAEALDAAAETGARRVYLTHLTHEHSHREIEEYCRAFTEKKGLRPIPMEPAWDGLTIFV